VRSSLTVAVIVRSTVGHSLYLMLIGLGGDGA
jgi:hypothetical protein